MPRIRTFLDTCSLITAFRGSEREAAKLVELMEDPEREFVSTSVVKLEVLPKPTKFMRQTEIDFYNLFFERVTHWISVDEKLMAKALEHGCRHGLGPLDSVHVAAALEGRVQEFITDERATKPFFAVPGLKARRISKPG